MNFRETQAQLEGNVAAAIDSAEQAHRMAAAQLFDQLGNFAPVAEIVGSVRPLYESGVAQLFELGRQVNRSGGELTRSMLDRAGI
ncbi:hypothetical protein [Turneriella parva]|uniref:Uncharacterized protein n=1 Tax=Turneriella parva (strain ATCC BAA-1111 / DSM 21527 / NCTC 11395 / H) TaxID=869212 RepID=I4B8J8_TURPD|nr:hypothetical protein [Turneriella parva]AFM13605.1 hypothetical protein Turpa_2966 [Turneriella parva DSM 21527]